MGSSERPPVSRNESGSALILIPAGVLIVVILGAIMVDGGLAFLGEREAVNAATAAANDVVNLGFDDAHFRDTGEMRLIESNADLAAITRAAVSRRESNVLIPGSVSVTVTRIDAQRAEVAVTGLVKLLLTPALPGAEHMVAVDANVTADARELLFATG